MAGNSSARANGWRVAAGLLLGVEALWWSANVAISATAFIQSQAVELLTVIPVVLTLLTLLAIVLLVRAPRAGVWVGLFLQLLVLGEAVVLAFASILGVLVAAALAIITTVCLAAVARPKRSAR